jgi:hypothetical protein
MPQKKQKCVLQLGQIMPSHLGLAESSLEMGALQEGEGHLVTAVRR